MVQQPIEGIPAAKRQHHADAKGTGHLEQRQQWTLARWIRRMRRQVAEHLVKIEQAAQRGGAREAPHPRHHLLEEQGDKEHALRVVQVGNVEHGDARAATGRVREGGDIQRRPLEPVPKARRGGDAVESHHQVHAVALGVKAVDIQHAEGAHRWALDRLDEAGQVQVLAATPGMLNDVRQEDVLATAHGVGRNAHQPQ